jgi:hypothetical protein
MWGVISLFIKLNLFKIDAWLFIVFLAVIGMFVLSELYEEINKGEVFSWCFYLIWGLLYLLLIPLIGRILNWW